MRILRKPVRALDRRTYAPLAGRPRGVSCPEGAEARAERVKEIAERVARDEAEAAQEMKGRCGRCGEEPPEGAALKRWSALELCPACWAEAYARVQEGRARYERARVKAGGKREPKGGTDP